MLATPRILQHCCHILIVAPIALFTSAPVAAADAQQPAPPNVLFIMADDLRPELACYGSPAITPNFDRLSRRSLQFDHAYCQQALCNPSRSSMLTGLRPDTLQQWNNSAHFRALNPDVTTLPLWFKEHGYTTRCVGKIFHNWHTTPHGDAPSWSAPEFLHFANHGDDAPQVTGELPQNFASPSPRQYGTGPLYECRDVPDEAYYDGRVAAEAVRVLTEVQNGPFFLAVGFWKPHAPFNAPKKYWDLYQRDQIPQLNAVRPENAPDIAFHQSQELRGAGENRVKYTAAQAAECRHGYFANISYLDAQLGKVLDALDASGVGERTIITFAGDHGYHIGEHDLWGKTSNFEYDARVPLMISAPGRAAGQRTTSIVELLDLFPTLVELCELPKPERLEGASLVPVLSDPAAVIKPAAFTQHPRPAYYDREPGGQPRVMGVSIKTPAVRYTEWRDWKSGETIASELYESADQPAELHSTVNNVRLFDDLVHVRTLLHAQFPPTAH